MMAEHKKKTLLPIGSVVLVRQEMEPHMIVSRFVRDEAGITWDYFGCDYPKGCGQEIDLLAFNREHVEELLFVGFQSVEEFRLRAEIDEEPLARLAEAIKENEVSP